MQKEFKTQADRNKFMDDLNKSMILNMLKCKCLQDHIKFMYDSNMSEEQAAEYIKLHKVGKKYDDDPEND